VSQDEIVSGFEYARDKYVEIDPEELDSLRTAGERALTIEAFIESDALDPLYYDGRAYYLLPDGDAASEAYAVLQQAMHRIGADGFGKVLFSGRNQLVRLRAVDGALVMQMLDFSAERKRPDEWAKKLRHARPASQNVKLAEELVRSMTTDDLEFESYEDDYRQRVKELIDAKREGREIVAPEEPETPEVVNLMDALRKSLARGQVRPAKAHADGKPKKTARKRATAAAKRRAS
jgi:DNA end-binding protein Ku